MKYVFVLTILTCLSGCVTFPLNTQDESRALGEGNFRLGATTLVSNAELNASLGIGPATDAFLQIQTELYSIGLKQTLVDKPDKHGLALLAGGFVGDSYTRIGNNSEVDGRGRDTGAFIGGTGNWYRNSATIALQLRHSFIDHHSSFAQQSFDFLLLERFRQVTQLSLTGRWRPVNSNFSLKGGINCSIGLDKLPERRSSFIEDNDRTLCLPVVGISFYAETNKQSQ